MRLTAVILAAFLYWPVPGRGQQHQAPQNASAANQDGAANHQGQTNAPAVTQQSKAIEDYTAEEAQAALSQAASNRTIVGITFALFVVGAIQASVYGYQSYLMRASIEQNRQSSERQLRAYVSTANFSHEAVTFSPNKPSKLPVNFEVLLKNSGQTPA